MFLKQVLQRILSPLGLALLCLLAGALLPARFGRTARRAAFAGVIVLGVPSLPVFADMFLKSLEDFTPALGLESYPLADAIVVLGGTAAPQWGLGYPAEELAGSRLLAAARLFRLGKARKIVATSGISYRTESGQTRTEAEDMRDILVDMGVPLDAIVVETRALDTRQNAGFSSQLLKAEGSNKILLVTTAYHLRRAMFWFEKNGLTVHPVGAGRSVRQGAIRAIDCLPSAAALNRSTAALKEYLGLAHARLTT